MTEPAKESTFVTVVAWLVIVFSGLGIFAGLLQSLIVVFAMPIPAMSEAESAQLPLAMRLIFQNFLWVVLAMTAFWMLTLVSAIALLKRHEGGRRVMTAVFGVAAIGTAAIALLQQTMMNWMFAGASDVPPDASAMILIMRTGSAAFALVFITSFTWVALRLNSATTRAEFRR